MVTYENTFGSLGTASGESIFKILNFGNANEDKRSGPDFVASGRG